MFEQETNGRLNDLEKALSELHPAASRVDRDELMFRAGQLSAPTRRGLWPAATALAAGLAIVLGVLLAARPAPQVRERVVVRAPTGRAEPAPPPPQVRPVRLGRRRRPPVKGSYLELRRSILTEGLNAWPAAPPRPGSARPATMGTLLRWLRRSGQTETPYLVPLTPEEGGTT
ncbi:MAG: hypothetical protein PVJ27_02110 [Candidatus Brocadiaceae bacterium]|jgi:hypothetical protein